MLTIKRPLHNYSILILVIFFLGIISRIKLIELPSWYINYAGDFLWAMLVFFIIALVSKLNTKHVIVISCIVTLLIEVSQLFHPQWLEYLRSIKILSFILGFTFFWSDLVAYLLGILLAALLDSRLSTIRES
jgi:hypothetical protein